MAAAIGRPPSDDELADALGIPVGEVTAVWRKIEQRRHVSLDTTHDEFVDGAGDLDRALVDPHPDPSHRLLAAEARDRLMDALKGLPDKQRLALVLYYFEKLTMAEIGRVLDVTEGRVSQLHKQALATLARRLGPRKDDFLDALGG